MGVASLKIISCNWNWYLSRGHALTFRLTFPVEIWSSKVIEAKEGSTRDFDVYVRQNFRKVYITPVSLVVFYKDVNHKQ